MGNHTLLAFLSFKFRFSYSGSMNLKSSFAMGSRCHRIYAQLATAQDKSHFLGPQMCNVQRYRAAVEDYEIRHAPYLNTDLLPS